MNQTMTLEQMIEQIESSGFLIVNLNHLPSGGWQANLCTKDDRRYFEFGRDTTAIGALSIAFTKALAGPGVPPLAQSVKAILPARVPGSPKPGKISGLSLEDLGL